MVKLLAVDGHKSGLRAFVLKGKFLLRHQERRGVVLAAGHERAIGWNGDGNAVGILHDLLVHQIIGLALGAAQIGAQGVGPPGFGILHLTGEFVTVLRQLQRLKGQDAGGLMRKFQVRIARADGIGAFAGQTQQHHAVFLVIVLIGDDVRRSVDLRLIDRIVDLPCGLLAVHHQNVPERFFTHAAVKGQQDVRRFVRTGGYRDRLNVSTTAWLRIRRIRGQHDSKLLPVLQRDGLHHLLNALAAPVPRGELFDKRPFDGPALLVAEFGLEDLRNEHPHAHAEQGILRLSHRAEVGVDVIKRLLHTLADADVSDRNFRLAAGDELDLRAAEFCSGKGETLRDLYSAVYRAVGADAEIHSILRFVHAAESAQLDRGIQNDHVELRVWQMKLQLLRADEVDALVGRAFILPLLSGELEGVAEAVNDLSVLAKSHNAHIACLERDLAGAEHHIAPALNEL